MEIGKSHKKLCNDVVQLFRLSFPFGDKQNDFFMIGKKKPKMLGGQMFPYHFEKKKDMIREVDVVYLRAPAITSSPASTSILQCKYQ